MVMISSIPALNTANFHPGPASNTSKIVQTGTGSGQFFNVTNNTGKDQTFVFKSEGRVLATMTLKAGQTGTFEAGPNTPGIRIQTSGPNGETNPNQSLYEDHLEIRDGKVTHNADISNVDGRVGYDGNREYITATNGKRVFGDGTTMGTYDYDIEDQVSGSSNPMQMAWDNESNTYNIVFSNQDPNLI
jgi:hypothetical protein